MLKVLGTSAGGGLPQWNCNCDNCTSTRNGKMKARTQSSLVVQSKSRVALFNAGPDVHHQLEALPRKNVIREKVIDDIFLVDSHIDHCAGLLFLRESTTPLNIYCTEAMYDDLYYTLPILKILESYCGVNYIPLKDCVSVFNDDVKITPVFIDGKSPPYSESYHSFGTNVAYVIKKDKTIFYSPGLSKIDTRTYDIMSECDIALIDGTFSTQSDLIDLHISKKCARDKGHIPRNELQYLVPPHVDVRYVHINNTNPYLALDDERMCNDGDLFYL